MSVVQVYKPEHGDDSGFKGDSLWLLIPGMHHSKPIYANREKRRFR